MKFLSLKKTNVGKPRDSPVSAQYYKGGSTIPCPMRCKNCGNEVPENSINCPSCYREINNRDRATVESKNIRNADRLVTFLLSLIPAAFGFLGMGQFYQGKYDKGLKFLIAGLPVYFTIYYLISIYGTLEVGVAFFALGATVLLCILYFIIFVIQLADAFVRTLLPL